MKLKLGILALTGALGFAQPANAQEVRVSLDTGACIAADFGLRRGRPYARVRPTYGRSYTSGRYWVEGCYVDRRQRVWIDGYDERVWQEPVYDYRVDECGRTVRVLVRAGCWTTVSHPGYYDWRTTKVWQPGHWSYRNRRR